MQSGRAITNVCLHLQGKLLVATYKTTLSRNPEDVSEPKGLEPITHSNTHNPEDENMYLDPRVPARYRISSDTKLFILKIFRLTEGTQTFTEDNVS